MLQTPRSSFEDERIRSRSQLQRSGSRASHVGSNDINNAWKLSGAYSGNLEGDLKQHQPISAFQGSRDPWSVILSGGHHQPPHPPPLIAFNDKASERQQSVARSRSSQMKDAWNIGAESPQSGNGLNELASNLFYINNILIKCIKFN